MKRSTKATKARAAGLFVLIFCLLASHTPAHAAPLSQAGSASQYTVGDCSKVDKNQLRDEIEAHASAVIAGTAAPLAIDSLVERKWAELGMDAAVDAAVTQAVNNLGTQEGYLDKFISGWWGEKAQEYAERIANDAFSSPAFKTKLEELSTAIGTDVARQVEGEFAQAASVALLCLKEYVGEQYSQTLFSAFERSVQMDTQQVDLAVNAAPVLNAADQHSLALAGVGTILVTQLVYRLAQKLSEKIAQRVAGKVVGRVLGKAGSSLIPVAGWIIGIAMIAYDLWEGTEGALPQIQEALQSEEVKLKIREEIATAIKDDLPDQAALIALETSVSLVEQWQGFCDRYGDVCLVADQNEDFHSLLNLVALDELPRLGGLLGWFMNQAGRTLLDAAIADGSLEQFLALPEATVDALIASEQPGEMMAWLALAGDSLPKVVEYRVQRLAAPEEFDAQTLSAILAVGNGDGVEKLLKLAPAQRNILLTLPADTLQTLVTSKPATQLATLANYMLAPEQPAGSGMQVAEEVMRGRAKVEEVNGVAVVVTATRTAPNVEMVAAAAPAGAASAPLAAPVDAAAQQPSTPGETGWLPSLLIGVLLAFGVAGTTVYGVRRKRRDSKRRG